jgi:hypothetical protein
MSDQTENENGKNQESKNFIITEEYLQSLGNEGVHKLGFMLDACTVVPFKEKELEYLNWGPGEDIPGSIKGDIYYLADYDNMIGEEIPLKFAQDYQQQHKANTITQGSQGTENITQGNRGNVEKQLTAEDRYIKDILWQRKVVMDALNNGNLACLPNEKGYADTQPAVNLINDTAYKGSTFLYLKEVQRQRGFPTAEYVSREQMDKAGEAMGKKVFVAEGQRGIIIPYKEQDKASGEWVPKHQTIFNIAQVSNPEVVREYAKEVQQEKEERSQAWAAENGKTLRTPWHETEIRCTSSDPEKYIGQYVTAVSFGARFKVTRTQAAEFADKTEKLVYEPSQTGKPNPMNLLKLSNQANTYAKEFRAEVIEASIAGNRERQQQRETEQKSQSRKREEVEIGY